MLIVRRAVLRYELYDPKTKKLVVKYKSINPDKKRRGELLGERKIWSIANEAIKGIKDRVAI